MVVQNCCISSTYRASIKGPHKRIVINDAATRHVDDPCPRLHLGKRVVVEDVLLGCCHVPRFLSGAKTMALT